MEFPGSLLAADAKCRVGSQSVLRVNPKPLALNPKPQPHPKAYRPKAYTMAKSPSGAAAQTLKKKDLEAQPFIQNPEEKRP